MFCKNCGAQNPDGAPYCANCGVALPQPAPNPYGTPMQQPGQNPYGAPAQNPYTNPNPGYAQPAYGAPGSYAAPMKPQPDKKKLMIIGGIVAAVVIAVIAFFMIGGGSPEEPVKALFDGVIDGNTDKVMSAFPKEMVDAIEDEGYDDELKEELKSSKQILKESGIKVSYEIKDKDKIDKNDVKDMEEEYRDMMDSELGIESDAEFTEGYTIDVELTAKMAGEEETEDISIDVYKVDGKWCIVGLDDMPF